MSSAANGLCPRGRWRLAQPGEVNRVLLFLSHILVRYEGTISPFGPLVEPADGAPDRRSREAAYAVASQIVAQLRKSPDAFARLAQAYSDDTMTRSTGGSLGGVPASYFRQSGEVLDCLSMLKEGQISDVIDSPQGYEIFLRKPAPKQAYVSADRVVIGYEGTLPIASNSAKAPSRTRAEALALARDVAAQARAGVPFDTLVQAHSDVQDRENGGDIGRWSNLELSALGREIEVLQRLETGEVSDPIDSPIGFEILRATNSMERPQYAGSVLKLAFDKNANQRDPAGRVRVLAKVDDIAKIVAADPDRFEAFESEYCCVKPQLWNVGRMPPGFRAVLDGLPIGRVSSVPIEDPVFGTFVLLKRLDPTKIPIENVLFEFPSPSVPDIDDLVRRAKPGFLAKYVRTLQASTANTLGLVGSRKEAFHSIHESLAGSVEAAPSPEDRVQLVESALGEIKSLLGEPDFDQYRALVVNSATAFLLGNSAGLGQ